MGYHAETDRQIRNFYSLSYITLRQLKLKLFRLPCLDMLCHAVRWIIKVMSKSGLVQIW